MATSQEHFLLVVTCRLTSSNSSKSSKDNKNSFTMLSFRSSKWREESQELRESAHKKKLRNSKLIF